MSQILHFKAGDVIFRQGYPSDNAYVIKSGKIEIYKETPGASDEHIAFLAVGEMFGEYGVLDEAPRSASARAVEDSVIQVVPI